MNALAGALRHPSRHAWRALSWALLASALLALGYLIVRIAEAYLAGRFASLPAYGAGWMLALACLVYLLGHGFRILRLVLLIGGWRVSLRDVAGFHLMTAAVSLTAPLKLGEVYRVFELSHLAGGAVRAITTAWLERAFDACALLALIILAAVNTDGAGAFGAVASLIVAFISATAIVVLVAPDNLRRLSVRIIRRHDTPASIPLLHALDVARRAILGAPRLLKGKLASLATLSGLIWLCEICAFMLAAPAFSASFEQAGRDLLAFLSAVTKGETLLAVLSSQPGAGLGASAFAYMAATQAPLAMLGAAASIHYVRRRLQS